MATISQALAIALEHHRAGRLNAAEEICRRILDVAPEQDEAWHMLGLISSAQGRLEEGIAQLRRAAELQPVKALLHYNLGVALEGCSQLVAAAECYRRALQLQPELAEASFNLGNVLKAAGQAAEAAAAFRRTLELRPDSLPALSNLLVIMHCVDGVTLRQLADAHAEFERRHAAVFRGEWPSHANSRDSLRRLRLGFVSPCFGRHAVGWFMIRALENFDQREVEIVCYSDRPADDDIRARFQAVASQWNDVAGLSDGDLARRIQADRIDILFDLAGHRPRNRLLVFARKPAPIQINWVDYVGTTGLKAMDYLLADPYQVPAASERWYCEKILRMPDDFICYDPPRDAPPVSALPALDSGTLRFGSFNQLAKTTPAVVTVWSEILRRLPGSQLVLKHDWPDAPAMKRYIQQMFVARGIDASRLALSAGTSQAGILAEYQRIDLALDTFPYNGGVTTCEALWMGVPVVTCPGETFASRHGLCHLSNVGLTETIARDLDEYVEIAVRLARDLPRLAAIRAGLRDRMATSPLCDGPRFSANLMTLLRDVWRRWCAGAGEGQSAGQGDVSP